MKITYRGKEREFEEGKTAKEIAKSFEIPLKGVLVAEINGKLVGIRFL